MQWEEIKTKHIRDINQLEKNILGNEYNYKKKEVIIWRQGTNKYIQYLTYLLESRFDSPNLLFFCTPSLWLHHDFGSSSVVRWIYIGLLWSGLRTVLFDTNNLDRLISRSIVGTVNLRIFSVIPLLIKTPFNPDCVQLPCRIKLIYRLTKRWRSIQEFPVQVYTVIQGKAVHPFSKICSF